MPVCFSSTTTLIYCLEYRHFLKEDLPRIAYANPNVVYRVDKSRQLTIEKPWAPSLQLEFGESSALLRFLLWTNRGIVDGTKHDIEVDGKQSGEIMKQVMKIAGGSTVDKQKATAP